MQQGLKHSWGDGISKKLKILSCIPPFLNPQLELLQHRKYSSSFKVPAHPPDCVCDSIRVTDNPFFDKIAAEVRPAIPAPTTTTSDFH